MLKALYLREELGDKTGLRVEPVIKTKQSEFIPFVLTTIGDYDCDERFFVDRSGYDTCLLMYTLSGEGVIRYENQEQRLRSGDIVVIDCRKYHFYAACGARWHFLWFHIEGKSTFDYVNALNNEGDICVHLGNRMSFRNYYDRLRSLAHNFDELAISVTLQKMLTDIIKLKNADTFSRMYEGYQNCIDDCVDYLQQHYQDNISVTDIAESCHLSKHYFIRVFRSYTGNTPYEFLLDIRLRQVRKLLLETSVPVAQIARDCGLGDSKNFIYHFRKRFGITPLQFRKNGY